MRATKDETIQKAHDQALVRTPQCRSCSCGTLLALMDTFDLRDEGAFKAASGLHGGIGGKGDVCGSLLGASIMIGLVCGSGLGDLEKTETKKPGPEETDKATSLVGGLYVGFRKEFGSVKCRTIRARFEKELDKDENVRGLPEPERTGKLFARCDELTAQTAAMAASVLWEITR